jgi:hypothetical protein
MHLTIIFTETEFFGVNSMVLYQHFQTPPKSGTRCGQKLAGMLFKNRGDLRVQKDGTIRRFVLGK